MPIEYEEEATDGKNDDGDLRERLGRKGEMGEREREREGY